MVTADMLMVGANLIFAPGEQKPGDHQDRPYDYSIPAAAQGEKP